MVYALRSTFHAVCQIIHFDLIHREQKSEFFLNARTAASLPKHSVCIKRQNEMTQLLLLNKFPLNNEAHFSQAEISV